MSKNRKNKKTFVVIFTLLVIVFLWQVKSFTDVPKAISYQGRLTDDNGAPFADGTYTMKFDLCTDASCTSSVWSDTLNIPVSNGLFSTRLGEGTPFGTDVKFNSQYYLQLSVSGSGITGVDTFPAQELSASAYSMNVRNDAITSEKIENGAIVNDDISNTANISWSKINTSGFVADNADKVDGIHADGFATASHKHDSDYVNVTGDNMTGGLNVAGSVGIGTTSPENILHLKSINNSGLILERAGVSKWQITAGDWTNNDLWFKNIGAGTWPFGMDGNGNVGIGTTVPGANLEVEGSGDVEIHVDANSVGGTPIIRLLQQGTMKWGWLGEFPAATRSCLYSYAGVSACVVTMQADGNIGIGTISPQGKLDVNGEIWQRGTRLHADYVFEKDYKLEPIEDHASFMWREKHLPAIPKATTDESGQQVLEIGADRKGIVEELEKPHIYIEQLHNMVQQQQEQIEVLKTEIEKLKKQ